MNALWLPWNLLYIPLYEAAKRRVYRWQLARTHAAADVSQVGKGLHRNLFFPGAGAVGGGRGWWGCG
jgi:hypothetical protein